MNFIKLIIEAKSTNFKQNMKRLLRKYLGNLLFHKRIISKLRKDYSHLYINYLFTQTHFPNKSDFNVWIMWWQGEKNMPDIIRICYNSVLQNSKGCEVRLITEENYNEYVSLPNYIIQKFNNGIIPIAQFSDIIRFALLAQHGGLWVDATTLVTNYNLIQLQGKFFTHRFKTRSQSTPTMGRWSITILAGPKNHLFFNLMTKLLEEYWKKENFLLKYFLTDYFILLLYTDLPIVRNIIDSVEWSRSNYMLRDFVNTSFSEDKWNEFIKNVHFHTLSRKVEYKATTAKGEETYYGYLLRTLNNKSNEKNKHTK